MNNYKGFIDNLIEALKAKQSNFKIIKNENNRLVEYHVIFDKPDKKFTYIHDENEIRSFTDDILFGLQGKQALPNIQIEGNFDNIMTREFIQSLFKKITETTNRDYLFNLFYGHISPSVLLRQLVNTVQANDDKDVIEDITGYILQKEIHNPNKEIHTFKELVKILKVSGNNYNYQNYKKDFLALLDSYDSYINDCYETNGIPKTVITYDPRVEVAMFIEAQESPKNYHEYKAYLPIVVLKDKPLEDSFKENAYEMHNFDLSFVSFIQKYETMITYRAVENMVENIINTINVYLNTNEFKGLKKIGQFKDHRQENYKTNIWFKIDKNSLDRENTIESGQYLIEQLANQYNKIVLEDDPDISIDQQLAKSIHKFALDCIVPQKEESVIRKMKI